MSVFSELKRRNVLRAAAAYIAVAWLVIQVTETLFPLFGLGDSAVRSVAIISAIGLVPALIVAWVFELTPDGFKRDSEIDRASPSVKAMSKRLDRLIMVVLTLALAYFAMDKFLLDPARDSAREAEIAETARQQGRDEASREAENSAPPMVAVLPFAAMSMGGDSSFFATGVHDDLLTQLAQLQSIRVISRTSVLEYKNTELNIREIGDALGADVILEGGVQTAGERIRINAQLIKVQTDEHLWAETYDRELSVANIFEIQTEIARSIADALEMTLTDREVTALTIIPTENMAAYRAYHRALEIRSTHMGLNSPPYKEALLEAITLDPTFTRALAEQVGSLALTHLGDDNPELIAQAEQALEQIDAVAPNSADYLIAQAYYAYYILKDYDLAHQLVSKAHESVPSDPQLLELKSWIERRQGDWPAMIDSLRHARLVDPRTAGWTFMLVNNLLVGHRYVEARTESVNFGLDHYFTAYHHALLMMGEHGDLQRLTKDLKSVQQEFANDALLNNWWQIHIVNRDYAQAAELLRVMPERDTDDDAPLTDITHKQRYQIISYWFSGQDELLTDILTMARANLANGQTAEGGFDEPEAILSMALVNAAEGNRNETERLIRHWQRTVEADWPQRVYNRDYACQILGMASAAEAAAACIRKGLEDPSFIMPFLEPLLPYYDTVRDQPAFVELLTELNGTSLGGT